MSPNRLQLKEGPCQEWATNEYKCMVNVYAKFNCGYIFGQYNDVVLICTETLTWSIYKHCPHQVAQA